MDIYYKSAGGNERFGMGDKSTSCSGIIGLELNIFGKKLEFSIVISTDRMRLADIVSPARDLSSKITKLLLDNNIKNVPCRKGCSDCCSHHVVPLSIPGAFKLVEDISAAPDNIRELIWNNSLQVSKQILQRKPPETFTEIPNGNLQVESFNLKYLSDWYSNLNITCPFLCNGLCIIYEQRPLACREHYITGSAKACRGGHDEAEVIDVPVQMPTVLSRLASELEETDMEAIMLPLSLIWCEENKMRAERTWPADLLVGRFVDIVQEMAEEHTMAFAEQPD